MDRVGARRLRRANPSTAERRSLRVNARQVGCAPRAASQALGGQEAEVQLRRLLQFSTSTSLNRAKTLTLAVTRTMSFTKAIAAI